MLVRRVCLSESVRRCRGQTRFWSLTRRLLETLVCRPFLNKRCCAFLTRDSLQGESNLMALALALRDESARVVSATFGHPSSIYFIGVQIRTRHLLPVSRSTLPKIRAAACHVSPVFPDTPAETYQCISPINRLSGRLMT